MELFSILMLGLGPVGGAFYLWDYAMKEGDIKLLASFKASNSFLFSSFGTMGNCPRGLGYFRW